MVCVFLLSLLRLLFCLEHVKGLVALIMALLITVRLCMCTFYDIKMYVVHWS